MPSWTSLRVTDCVDKKREMVRVKEERQDRQHKCTAVIGHTGKHKSPELSVSVEMRTLFQTFTKTA